MAINASVSGESLARGLSGEFKETWKVRLKSVEEKLGRVMRLGIGSDKIEELYGYWEPPLHPRYTPWGEEIEGKPFRARNFAVENLQFSSSVEWYDWQRRFDQLKDLERSARRGGDNFGRLPLRIFTQIISGATNADLLPYIPLAPDGASLFSATDGGGGDRFGVSGGNVITGGAGIGTGEAVRTDFFNGIERVQSFQDPEGQPHIDPSIIDEGIEVWYPNVHEKVFREAFLQSRPSDGTTATTNVVLESGLNVRLHSTAYLTGDDWYLFMSGIDLKPVFEQVAMPLEEVFENKNNSDRARRTGLEGLFWKTFRGYGVNLPLGAVKIDN